MRMLLYKSMTTIRPVAYMAIAVFLCFSFAVKTFAADAGVTFSTGPSDSVLAGGGKSLPVYSVKQGEKLLIHFALTTKSGSASRIALSRIADTPFSCSTPLSQQPSGVVKPSKPCELAFVANKGAKQLVGDFIITPLETTLGGDFPIDLEASGFEGQVAQSFILRLVSPDPLLATAGNCAVRAPEQAIFLPQGGRGPVVLDVALPFKAAKNTTIELSGSGPEGIAAGSQKYINTLGTGLLVMVSVPSGVSPGVYKVRFNTQLIGASKISGGCELTVVVEAVLREIIAPDSITLEVGQDLPIQLFARLGDGGSVDVTVSKKIKTSQSVELVLLQDGVITGKTAGEGVLILRLADEWSDSGYIAERAITLVVSQPKDFRISLSPDIVSRGGSRVFVPVAFECLGDFADRISQVTVSTGPYNKTVFAKLVDSKGVEVQEIIGCQGDYFLSVQTHDFVSPLSEDPPFDTPQLIVITAKGANLPKDYGFGNGVRAAATQLVVLRYPSVELHAESPVVIGSKSLVTWKSQYATECRAEGQKDWEGLVDLNASHGKEIGPFSALGEFEISLTCSAPYGGRLTKTATIAVEEKRINPSTAGLLPGARLDNSLCQNVFISWPVQAGASNYRLYRGTSSGGNAKVVVAELGTNTSYKDSNLAEGVAEYYWLDIVTADGVMQRYLGSTGVRSCRPDLSVSDMDIISVENVDLETEAVPCNGISERIKNNEIPGPGNPFTLRFNICNTGQRDVQLDALTVQLSYLAQIQSGLPPLLVTYDSTGKVTRQTIAKDSFQIIGAAPNLSIIFNKLPVLASSKGEASYISLELPLVPFLPAPAESSVYQFTAKALVSGTYKATDNSTQTLTDTFILPSYVFYLVGRNPYKAER